MNPVTRRWRTWTLRRQLVVAVSTMVLSVVAVLGVLSTATLSRSVDGMVDSQLDAAAEGFGASVVKFRSSPTPSGELPAPGTMKPLTHLVGQAPGNIVVLIRDGVVMDSALFGDGEAQRAPASATDVIRDRTGDTAGNSTVHLPGLGNYRIQTRNGGPGELLVTGVSNRAAEHAVTQQNIVVSSLTALTLLVTGLGTFLIVRHALRPLGRVAAAAAEVVKLPLDRDNYAITVRVPEEAADRRTEVGLVGHTLNTLLAHVGGALAEVAASDRRMRRFITDASHELRTPLAAVLGHAELTRQDSDALPETTEYALARIESESKRMNALVSDLLLLARLDEGHDIENTLVNLADIVRDAVNDAAVIAPSHHWRCETPTGALWCRGDQAQLHQTVANLLSNARTHTPPGTTVVVVARAVPDAKGPHVEVTITDDGPGIAADLVPHLFERFVRADTSRSRQAGSTGLGLAIVASIVEAHHGTVTAESRPGQTTFRIRLPEATAPRVADHHDVKQPLAAV